MSDCPTYSPPGVDVQPPPVVPRRPACAGPPDRPTALGHDTLRWADGRPVLWPDTSPVYLSGLVPVPLDQERP